MDTFLLQVTVLCFWYASTSAQFVLESDLERIVSVRSLQIFTRHKAIVNLQGYVLNTSRM